MVEIQEIKKIISEQKTEFLRRINLNNRMWIRSLRHKNSNFPIFRPANEEYFQFKHQEQRLEWDIRIHLVNGILHRLFNSYGISCFFFDERNHSKQYHVDIAVTCNDSNEKFEELYPFEFVLHKDDKRIGYRYFSLSNLDARRILDDHRVDMIRIIDWTDTDDIVSSKHYFCVDSEIRDCVEYYSVHQLFSEFFSEEAFQLFIDGTRDAVTTANEIIGFQTISQLSLRNVSDFKLDIIDRIARLDYRSMIFKLIDGSALDLRGISASELETVYSRFSANKLYKSLSGTEDFAISFFTSEYLYHVFKRGFNFDYTSVVSGYLKSVEQLVYKIVKCALDRNQNADVWIKRRAGKHFPKYIKDVTRSNPVTNQPQVPFMKEYELYFDITLTPLIWCLHDNESAWYLSKSGIEAVHDCLLSYAQDCRNDHFHKDNIYDFDEVERIRTNTLLCIFFLIGGCKITGDIKEDALKLGLVDDGFDRLYKELAKISVALKNFHLTLNDGTETKAIRLRRQEELKYDQNGYLLSNIRFAKIDDYDIGDDGDLETSYPPEDLIIINRDNMPLKIAYVIRGKLFYIEW